MKFLLSLLPLLFLLGCINLEEEQPQRETYYVPTTLKSGIEFEGSTFGIPESLNIDTTFSDTNQLMSVTQDSIFLYSHDGVTSYREGNSLAAPVLPFELDTSVINDAIASQGIDGIKFTSYNIIPKISNFTVENGIATYEMVQEVYLYFSYSGLTVAQKGVVTVISTAIPYDGPVLPDHWPEQK